MIYKTKAPGSLMLFGEYAVLQGKIAIVAAIDKFISISLSPRRDEKINIDSPLGNLTLDCQSIKLSPPFEFVLAALASKKLPSGCDINIKSTLPPAIGLGSSAAVTVALLTALNAWLQMSMTKNDLWQQALTVIKTIQGKGSGADCAASVYGGVLAFSNPPFSVASLKPIPPITAIYSGKKLTTARAIDIVNQRRQKQPDFYQQIDERINELTVQAIKIINSKNWVALGRLLNLGQELMTTLGVSNEILESLIEGLRKQPTIFGAKISGAGLGDCVIGIGILKSDRFPRNNTEKKLGIKQIVLSVAAEGVTVDA
ncbi:mevalonate kinase [Coxiella endosymbiont of Ornithodoros amblus]|uniref:mevalonate kinase n=1 Tax=Coxiella endosymbiont of Ornithodoros amblus TaxID=1656166 RepID=UPI00244E0C2A|nr:mevalonate kinase [Coxiella endosymbiont of Ornithodoros amblus]MBW5802320.1 mevalonate kinase [Coxiella endosymbiont of Ornithodoros amblus]